jgi:SnoaL-like protein
LLKQAWIGGGDLLQRETVAELVSGLESRDAEALSELCADDAVVHHPLWPEPVRGRTAIRASERPSTSPSGTDSSS